jgi:aspartate beta-hydroxylase
VLAPAPPPHSLADKPEWARVYGRLQAKRSKTPVPAPTPWHEPSANLYPGLTAAPFHAPDAYGTLAEAVMTLERFYPVIKAEMLALRHDSLTQYRQPQAATTQRELSADGVTALLHEHGDWLTMYLQREGAETSAQCKQAPKTAKIVRSLARGCGHALFSVLEPGTHILPHCGPSNFRLRLHLGLVIPEHGPAQRCSIRVGDQERSWQEGRVLVLDDAFQHEVWNETSAQRIVLIVDIWHPEFSDKEIAWIDQTRAAKRSFAGPAAAAHSS